VKKYFVFIFAIFTFATFGSNVSGMRKRFNPEAQRLEGQRKNVKKDGNLSPKSKRKELDKIKTNLRKNREQKEKTSPDSPRNRRKKKRHGKQDEVKQWINTVTDQILDEGFYEDPESEDPTVAAWEYGEYDEEYPDDDICDEIVGRYARLNYDEY